MNAADAKTSEFHRQAARFLGAFLIAVGGLFLVTVYTSNAPLLERGVRAKGVIERMVRGPRGTFSVDLRVETPKGEMLRIGTIAGRQSNFQVGEVVHVIYNSEYPSGAWFSRGEQTWDQVRPWLWLYSLAVALGLGLSAWGWVTDPVRKFWRTGRE